MKTFFDGIFLKRNAEGNEEIRYPIRLEYFRTADEEKNVKKKYGIVVVKKEYFGKNVKIEKKEFKNITNSIKKENKILTLLKNNAVTPFGLEDVLKEII